MLVRRAEPSALEGRKIVVHVLDRESAGPAFGERALEALKAEGFPLHGLDATLRHVPYDWSEPSALGELGRAIGSEGAACAVSSEGSLFEYGSDEDIAANLRAFAQAGPDDAAWVGTQSRADGDARLFNSASGAAVRLRGREELAAVAEGALWRVERSVDCPLSVSFRLARR